ncbi:MAG TPA: hypothetical protein PLH94_12135 [Fimbriimonadaceae bacterium]|nr:hypothetical protein [Fimbriimonadaceae bacterium]
MVGALHELSESRNLCAVYPAYWDERFYVGWVLNVNESFYTMLALNSYGHSDGLVVASVEDVRLIRESNDYLKSLERVAGDPQENLRFIPQPYPESVPEAIERCRERGEIMRLTWPNGQLSWARILDFDDETVKYTGIDANGREDGNIWIASGAIRAVDLYGNSVLDLERNATLQTGRLEDLPEEDR